MDNLITRSPEKIGMKINVKKTKVMLISRKINNKLKIYVDKTKSGTSDPVQIFR